MRTSLKHTVIFAMLLMVLWGCSGKHNTKQNRLQFASSPYLQEHADNPVDWYEWGEEALAKAKQENKPLLISVGYASCHWCHEMEKESFMDTTVARVMNEKFVCIKVDREERPDIDQVYMNALQLISGDAGWPLNAFALPDGKPFFAGTYYDKKSWINLLNSISKAFVNRHTLVVTQANALVNGIAEQDVFLEDSTTRERSIVSKAVFENGIYSQADLINGGFKGAQKFPTPVLIDFLLQHYYITKDKRALALADTTLLKMALGGIYDQVGGGFARYATDSLWRVPHFEKMLYDNGQMISVYAHAYQLTKNEFYKDKITEIIRFAETKLAAPGGGYYSSLNADTEAGEGMYYAWKRNDFASITGIDKRIADYYQLTEKGNWKPGYNILYAALSPSAFASSQGVSPAAFNLQLNEAKTRLLKEREKRAAPSTDTKIITAWNCIMIKGYADAYAATGNPGYLEKAKSCAVFIETNMTEHDGSLKRNFKDSKALIEGFLDDYAWAVAAMIRLYEVSFDMHWVDLAKKMAGYAIRNFYNEKNGLFFYSGKGSSLVLRQTEVADDALPSSNALMARNLYLLGKLYDDTTYTAKVMVMKSAVADRVSKMPRYHLQWCSLFELLSARSYEIAISGKDALLKNSELQLSFLPTSIVMGSTGAGTLPLLKDKFVEGKTFLYVCTDKMCKRPESETVRAIGQIK